MLSTIYELSVDTWDGAKRTYNETTYFTKISILMIFITFLIGSCFAFWIILFRGSMNFMNVSLKPLLPPKIFN